METRARVKNSGMGPVASGPLGEVGEKRAKLVEQQQSGGQDSVQKMKWIWAKTAHFFNVLEGKPMTGKLWTKVHVRQHSLLINSLVRKIRILGCLNKIITIIITK